MKRITGFILVGLGILVMSFAFVATAQKTQATVCQHDCHQPTPTPTPTPIPHHFTCNEDHQCVQVVGHGENNCESNWDCHTHVSPTPTPTVTPEPTSTPSASTGDPAHVDVSDGNAPGVTTPGAAVCTVPFNAPILQGFHADGNGSVTFSWWGVSTDKYSIRYGYKPDQLVYGEDNIPASSTSIQLNGLLPGAHVWAIVTAWQGGCAADSNELDPVVR